MPKKRKVQHRPSPPHPSVMAGKKNGNWSPPTHSPSGTGDKKKRKLPPPRPIPPEATVNKKEKRSSPPPPPRRSSRSTEKKQAPPPSPSGSSSHSSSEEEESPTPGTLMEKNFGGSTADVPTQRTVPISNSSGSAEDEEGSESEESNQEESSSDSDAVPATSASFKSNPLSQLQESELPHGKKPSNSIGSSDSGSEDSRQGSEEATSSSESQQLPPSQLKTTENDRGKETAAIVPGSVTIYGEGVDSMDNAVKTSPPQKRSSQIAAASKRVGSPDQPADKSNEAMKQRTPSPASTVQKNRKTSTDDGEEAGEEKKVLFKRVWSMADEVLLLQAILDYKEGHHIIPSSLEQLVPILNSTKDSLSISATLNQMYDKIRRMKLKYRNIVRRVNGSRNLHNLNGHDAIIFDLSRKIWGSNIKQHVTHQAKINTEEDKKSDRNIGEEKQFHEEYPSLYRLLKSEYPTFAIPVPLSDIPISEARDLDENCKKLESMEIQLLMERQTSLGDVFKLFKTAHAKSK
ncbi:hypothetical protein HPP92_013161 [Vanilla planifolia]|uniref:Glabrous enhancer-binding protein-like DBD domain-containing protein n=1 Tax=Vanilla planifolia TaxID=51239 RepID=A0A835R1F3_VANPL|nr:hypothetical protein HPP92_013161 [Vanilla planifolia]